MKKINQKNILSQICAGNTHKHQGANRKNQQCGRYGTDRDFKYGKSCLPQSMQHFNGQRRLPFLALQALALRLALIITHTITSYKNAKSETGEVTNQPV